MIEVRTPCRLHFGLLAFSHDESRQFGGVGVMVQRPDIVVRVEEANEFTATGPMAERALKYAQTFADRTGTANGAAIQVERAPRSHTGLGTGTQLGMAVGRAMAELIGRDDVDANELAHLVGRGERSAIGVHGFFHGGLIVEGGKLDPDAISPLLVHQAFPEDWRIVLISPQRLEGISGDRERKAFGRMPAVPVDRTAEMCRLVMLGLLPAMIESDIDDFGESLFQLQQEVGRCFKSQQGGIYADPMLEQIIHFIRDRGVRGVGQSSWGPTLYAVTKDEAAAKKLVAELRIQFALADDELLITRADNVGNHVRQITSLARD